MTKPSLSLPIETWTSHGHHYIMLEGHPHLSVGATQPSQLRGLLRALITNILHKHRPVHREQERLLIATKDTLLLVEQQGLAFGYTIMSRRKQTGQRKTGFHSYKDALQAARQLAYDTYGGVVWENRLC